jgi:hypothetical protein
MGYLGRQTLPSNSPPDPTASGPVPADDCTLQDLNGRTCWCYNCLGFFTSTNCQEVLTDQNSGAFIAEVSVGELPDLARMAEPQPERTPANPEYQALCQQKAQDAPLTRSLCSAHGDLPFALGGAASG